MLHLHHWMCGIPLRSSESPRLLLAIRCFPLLDRFHVLQNTGLRRQQVRTAEERFLRKRNVFQEPSGFVGSSWFSRSILHRTSVWSLSVFCWRSHLTIENVRSENAVGNSFLVVRVPRNGFCWVLTMLGQDAICMSESARETRFSRAAKRLLPGFDHARPRLA